MLRPRPFGLTLGALLALLLTLTVSAQTAKPSPPRKVRTADKPKLTPQQQTGLSILEQQVGVAKGLSPVMRAFASMEIARGYEKLDLHKALSALRDAFQASQSIEDSDPKTSNKTWVQGQVLDRLVALDPAYCEQLVPRLAGPPRSTAINRLIMYHTRKKQFAQAIALLGQLGDEEFPYIIGSNLVAALPPEMAADKQNLFAQALASFSQHEHKNEAGPGDFGTFISRTWRGLPPDMVLQAIDESLKQARQSDTDLQITVGAEKGSASFSSIYQYTLFQLMPILRVLDSDRAESLLQENRDVQSAAKQYPNGLQSLDPENGIPDSITMRLPSNSGESTADDRYDDQLQSQIRQIIAQAEKDPKQALAAAMSLPDFHNTRALALLKLAGAILKTSPGYAANALDELMKIIPSIQRDIVQFDMLAGAGDDYLKLGNTESAKKVVDQGFRLAEKLYATDTDADDPNQAFKAMWPSTSAWRRFVALATRISPQTALQTINSIPDPEIQALETIALADSLLGAPPATQMVAVKTKSKNSYMVGLQ